MAGKAGHARHFGRGIAMSKGIQDCAFSVSMIVIGAWLWWEAIQPRYQTSAAQDYGFSPTFLPRILIGMWIVINFQISIKPLVLTKLSQSQCSKADNNTTDGLIVHSVDNKRDIG